MDASIHARQHVGTNREIRLERVTENGDRSKLSTLIEVCHERWQNLTNHTQPHAVSREQIIPTRVG